jgi:hypothetical protein
MSLILQSTGGGSVTIQEPVTASNLTITVPATTGTMALTSNIPAAYTNADALTLFNASGSAPVYACRAWVNFNGTGTVAIRASGNVSSITDNGTGDYSVNFTTAMSDASYSAVANASADTTTWSTAIGMFTQNGGSNSAPSTSAFRFVTTRAGGAITDKDYITVSVFR